MISEIDIQTIQQVATICATIADNNRGCLQIGDMIRKQFNLPDPQIVIQKPKESRLKRIK